MKNITHSFLIIITVAGLAITNSSASSITYSTHVLSDTLPMNGRVQTDTSLNGTNTLTPLNNNSNQPINGNTTNTPAVSGTFAVPPANRAINTQPSTITSTTQSTTLNPQNGLAKDSLINKSYAKPTLIDTPAAQRVNYRNSSKRRPPLQ